MTDTDPESLKKILIHLVKWAHDAKPNDPPTLRLRVPERILTDLARAVGPYLFVDEVAFETEYWSRRTTAFYKGALVYVEGLE